MPIERKTPGWTNPEEQAQIQRAYEDELVRRYEQKLPLTKLDKRDARRIIRQRKEA